jgi:hypothetical protein
MDRECTCCVGLGMVKANWCERPIVQYHQASVFLVIAHRAETFPPFHLFPDVTVTLALSCPGHCLAARLLGFPKTPGKPPMLTLPQTQSPSRTCPLVPLRSSTCNTKADLSPTHRLGLRLRPLMSLRPLSKLRGCLEPPGHSNTTRSP